MKYIEKYIKRSLWTFLSIIISMLILTGLYYFDIISTNIYNYLKLFILLLNIFIQSYILGKNSSKHGYLEGLKFAGIIIVLFLVISLLVKAKMRFRIIMYYSIILISSMFGGMVGISKKVKK